MGINQHFEIFGDNYPTPDGTCIRDYLHVMDLANAHVSSLQKLQKGTQLPFAMNLGTGKGYSVKEVIQITSRVTGKPIAVNVKPRRAGDPAALVATAKLAETHIDFVPKYNLEQAIQHSWQWLSKVKITY